MGNCNIDKGVRADSFGNILIKGGLSLTQFVTIQKSITQLTLCNQDNVYDRWQWIDVLVSMFVYLGESVENPPHLCLYKYPLSH